LSKAREVAFKAAHEAGALLLQRLGNVKDVGYKSAYNIVTDVDKASEKTILEILRAEFPDYDVLAEEGGNVTSGCDYRWLVDPLDGTTNYTHAYPFFCVSIGLEFCGEIVLGVVFNPVSKELFWAEKGQGAWLNDQQIKTSKVNKLSASLLSTGFPPDTRGATDNNMRRFSTLTDISHGVRRDGSAALDLSFVACGRFDGFWEMKLSPWDTAAGSLMVTEAGGTVTNLSGQKFDISSGHILATNSLIHDETVAVMKELEREFSAGSAAGTHNRSPQ
jgi:myo-inositol-1(or 4)-monophosphatase